MLTSDKQTHRGTPMQKSGSGPWQVKTKEGMYYQPESLAVLYQWICENRLCSDDFIFSAPSGDWIPVINMPELVNCFWQLLTSGNVVYGPVSLGELKQLYVNSQITSSDKVTISGKGNWVEIREIPVLNDWLVSTETPAIDYVQFIDGLGASGYPLKEVKISEELLVIKQQDKENIRYIKELETAKKQLEEELANKKEEVEGILGEKSALDIKFQSGQDELEGLQLELKERLVLIEELNKHIAQAEVSGTLKDDEIGQLRSSIASIQEELEKTREENTHLRQSLPEAVEGLEKTIDELQGIISEKGKLLDESNNRIGELIGENKELDEKIISLHGIISEKEAEVIGYRETIAKLQGELAERDRELAGAGELEIRINELSSEIDGYRQRIDDLSGVLEEKEGQRQNLIDEISKVKKQYEESLSVEGNRLREEIRIREDTINELKCNLDTIQEEYKAKVREWEESISIQKAQFQEELASKTKLWDETYSQEKGKWEKIKQDFEGEIAQRDAQIENQRLEIERLHGALISQDKQWKERMRAAKEESDRLYNELEKQREDLHIELTQKINELITERDIQQERLADIERSHKELIQRQDVLQKDLLDREKFIESIKAEAKRQEESYKVQVRGVEQRLYQANEEISILQSKVQELTNQLQNESDIQEGLRRDISIINEDLSSTRKTVEQLEREKNILALELASRKEEFTMMKSQLEHELEEVKRNLEHSEEENRSLQKQFYLEKQKLTKEYTETINKQEKLYKRSQLEREIQDRTKTKDELERLYNLLKESFEGLQSGATQIQVTLQGFTDDIENKRLSLKYLIETEKRNGKKGQPSKDESVEEAAS